MAHSNKGKGPRFGLALAAGKLTAKALNLVGREGGQLPGVIAERICPDFLGRIDTPEHLVFVTGSNGKTTTTNLIADLLVACGQDPLINRVGGNIDTGIASTLLKSSTFGGAARKRSAVLELDERSARTVFPYITPDVLVVTNLYRDTFTRNAHVDYVADILSRHIPDGCRLVLNADDLISARLAPENPNRVYFSLCPLPSDTPEPDDIVLDLTACPSCGGHLSYEYAHLGHIGRLTCDECGLTNPRANYEAVAVDYDAQTITVRENDEPGTPSYDYHFSAGSVTDLYNLLGAIVAARLVGLVPEQIQAALLGGVGIVASRYSEKTAAGRRIVNIASKGENGMACSRGFANIKREPGDKAVVLMIEDYYKAKDADSTEFCGWFYETDFEYLADPSVRQIVVAGVRSEDMILRMLLAGIDPAVMVQAKDGSEAADLVNWRDAQTIYYSHAIHNEYPAEESRDRLIARIERETAGEEVRA